MLQREVEMRRESAAARRNEIDDGWRAVHRLERADSKNDVCIEAMECLQQIQECHRRRQVASVRAEMHTGEYDLLESSRGHANQVPYDFVNTSASLRSSGLFVADVSSGIDV